MTAWAPWKYDVTAGYVALDSKFTTGAFAHKLSAGFYGRKLELREYQDNAASKTLSGAFSFSDPVYVAEPSYSIANKRLTDSSLTENKNFFMGDTVEFNKSWSALVGLNYAQIITKSYDLNTGITKASYDKSEAVPSLSLIYKPIPQLSTYATYTEGLEKGGTAPTTAANANQIMSPMLSKQYEVGAKATLDSVLLTAAFFQIEKAFEYTDTVDNVYKQDGRQVHKGFEFSATGRPTRNLTLFGGFTLMQAKVTDASKPSLENKTHVDVAQQSAKLYAEYDIDKVPGLTFTGGMYYMGKQAADNLNDELLPSVVTGDIGARYQMKICGNYPLIFRLNVTNVTNEKYWVNSSYTGDPRTFLFSTQVKF
jgi:iron complex outermembrane recepter protein